MKKQLYLLLIFVTVLSLIFSFASCDLIGGGGDTDGPSDNTPGNDSDDTDGKPDEEHTHKYDKQIIDYIYRKSEATCDSAAVYYYSCECGEKGTSTFTSGKPLEHNWQDPTCTEDGYCSLCKAAGESAKGHDYVDGYCTVCKTPDPDYVPDCKHEWVDPTCTEDGYCSICKEPGESAKGHDFVDGYCTVCKAPDPDYTPDCKHEWVDPTCTEDGYCSICKEPGESAKGHNYVDGYCTVCKAPDPDYVPECQHEWVEPTCEYDGYCVKCDAPGERAFGHSYIDGFCENCGDPDPDYSPECDHYFTPPTCTEDGFCNHCGEPGESATGHKWTVPTCTEGSFCLNCGIPGLSALDHVYVNGYCEGCGAIDPNYTPECQHEWVAPTCTEDGYCAICKEPGESAKGHNYVDGYCEICKEPDPDYVPDGPVDPDECFHHNRTEATCTEDSVCLDCGTILINAYGHEFTDGYCYYCGMPDPDYIPECTHSWSMATCTEPAYCYMCGIAGEPPLGHEWQSVCGDYDWCNRCSQKGDHFTEHVWVCLSCEDNEHCEKCGIMSGNPPLGHNYVDGYCTRCGLSDPNYECPHKNLESKREEPDCTYEGFVHYYCPDCGYSYSESIGYGDHSFDENGYCHICGQYGEHEHIWVEPTCTEDGYCSVCKQTGEPALEHLDGEWRVFEAPTCTIDGVEYLYCARCDEILNDRTLPAPGHRYTGVEHAPTCTTEGYIVHTCTQCGVSYVEYTAPSLGHQYGYVVEPVAPTCNEIAYSKYTCHCGAYVPADFGKALGHTWGEDGFCTVCAAVKPSEGFEFTLDYDNNIGNYYKITGLGSCADTNVIIPDVYEGYPVKHINRLMGSPMTSVVIPDTVVVIDSSTFTRCASLTEVHIPKNVMVINLDCFEGCSSLEKITVSEENEYFKAIDGVLYSADGSTLMFYPAQKKEETLVIPEGVTNISKHAFSQTEYLKKVIFPEGYVKNSDAYAFYGCQSLEEVVFSYTTTEIYLSMFHSCSNLASITLPEGLVTIHTDAFRGCSSLTEILLPETVLAIGDGAFAYCTSLYRIELSPRLSWVQEDAFYKTALKSVIIPDTATKIDSGAFDYCNQLVYVVIGNGVKSIGSKAFTYTGSTVYYHGTAEEWAAVTVTFDNTLFNSKTPLFYSEERPTEEGDFWHYVDGVPTEW